MTTSFETYRIQALGITDELSTFLTRIYADGILTLDETEEAKIFYKAKLAEFRALKKGIRATIREVRHEHQIAINSAKGGWFTTTRDKQKAIRSDIPHAIEGYQSLIVVTDQAILTIEDQQQEIETINEQLKQQSKQLSRLSISPLNQSEGTSIESENFPFSDEPGSKEDYRKALDIEREEINDLLDRVKQHQQTALNKQHSASSEKQIAYLQGIHKAFSFFVDELEELLVN